MGLPVLYTGARAIATTGAGNAIKQSATRFLSWFGYGSTLAVPIVASSTTQEPKDNKKKLLLTAGVIGGAYLLLKK